MATDEAEILAKITTIITNTIGIIHPASKLANLHEHIKSNDQVIKFITSYNINVLIISLSQYKSKPQLTLSTNVLEQTKSSSNTAFLIKNQSVIISKQNINNILSIILSTTDQHNITNLCRASIQNLFVPYFKSTQSNIATKLDEVCSHIEATSVHSDDDDHNLSKITSIDDEIRYWYSKERSIAEAKSFYELLHPLKGRYNDVSKQDIVNINTESILNNINELHDVFRLLWTHNGAGNYPNHRMRHLLYIIDDYIAKFISLSLIKHVPSPFVVSFGDFQISIQKLIAIYNEWMEIRNNNLIKYFKQNPKRWIYDGNECNINYIFKRLYDRMNDVLIIRTLYKQMDTLISCTSHFDVFQSMVSTKNNSIWLCNDKHQSIFHQTKEIWYKKMSKSIKISGEMLDGKIKQISSESPQLLMAEFENFSILLQQNIVSCKFKAQKQKILNEMNHHFGSIKREYEELLSCNDGELLIENEMYTTSSQSQSVLKMIACHRLTAKVEQFEEINHKLIQNESFKHNIFDIKRDLRDLNGQIFKIWMENQEDILSQSGLNDNNKKVMELDLVNDGELMVHYSDDLVTLINDMRLLKEFGYKMATKLQKGYETALKFYKYAVQLKQIANFYNTMSSQIIQSQKGLLLNEAQRFEQIIKHKNALTWDKPKECQLFIKKLMNASEQLAHRNKRLRNLHHFINTNIKVLMDIDLFSQYTKWDEVIAKVSHIFKQEAKSNTNKAIAIWIMYWDSQLFKLFLFQYKKCITKISKYIKHLHCHLIFDRHRKLLRFRPSLKEMKHKLKTDINKLIDKPNDFKGFGLNSDLYSKILKKKEIKDIIESMDQNINGMMNKLSATIKEYTVWIAFGAMDFDKEILPKLSDISKYEEQFKFIQYTAKRTEEIPDDKQIDECFTISFIPFKNTLDDMCHKFEDSLIVSLKKNVTEDIHQLTEYIQSGLSILNKPPNDVAELTDLKKSRDQILAEKAKYQSKFDEIHNKNNVLINNLSLLIFQSQYTSSERKAMDLTEIEQKWDFFEHSLLVFDDMLQQQRSNLRSNVEKKMRDFKNEIEKFNSRWNALKPKEIDDNLNPKTAHQITQQIKEWREEHTVHYEALHQLKQECEFFEITIDIPLLDIMDQEISLYESSWSVYSEFVKEIEAMEQELWISFRTRLLDFQDFYELWQKKIKQIQTENKHNDTVFIHMKREMKQFEDIWPLLRCITGELFETEHWNILFYKLCFTKNINLRNLKFGDLLRAKDKMIQNGNALKNLANRAQGEVTIRESIQELQVWIENEEFDLTKMESKSNDDIDISLIKGWKDLLIKIGDQLSLLSSLKESPYFESFSDRVSSLEERFIKLDESLRLLNIIQRKWVYLQPIFSKGALPKEQARFARIDDSFIMIMKSIEPNKNVMNLLSIHNVDDTLCMLVDQLERCQKALSDYLEDKRSKFPRFYFLGDDDMLQILGQSMNPKVIQTHLKKLYQGISRVVFSKNEENIIAIQSANNETVMLSSPVSVSVDVEIWLNNLTKQMKSTLKQQLFECLKQFDVEKYPSQILCLSQSIQFTLNVDQYITNSSSLSKYHGQLQKQLEEYTATNTTNDPLSELKIKSLILDIIHYIQVIELLLENRVNSVNDWLWLKQLRFYINKSTQNVTLRMVNAEFSYSFEYQGNAPKLVHTPLTDKCYLVLTQGMHLGFGGNPYGPAGTGKTESVKALGHYMGRQVLVFNCDEAIDFKSMGRIFTGLVQCGAWGCFDEFNRLKEDQLSAVSQQIQIIQTGLRNKYQHIKLLNTTIKLNSNSGIFVTMNPASKEYGGRSKLPDNLKQLFRSVAMTKPDSELIAQVLLYSEGFKCAKIWGNKLNELYTLSKQLLSPEKHYDWGLRALKSVLNSSGNSLRETKRSGINITKELEMSLLLKSLRINTLSKLTFKDSQKFANLVNDVFADKALKDQVKNEESFQFKLGEQIKKELEKANLKLVNNQFKKIIELHEALSQRMGVVIVGPSQCGKSTLYHVLHKCLTSLGQHIEIYVMNPKAVDRQQLLGYMDIDTREWFDGILTRAARQSISNSTDNISTWIICDGDIDPEWIESLNSVLDDNHLLSLPNGERIQFGINVNFIFETHDLSFASPATISRMGMIYLSEQDIQLNTLIDSWILKNCSNDHHMIQNWMNDIFMKTVSWIVKNIINNPNISSKMSFVVPTTIIGMVTNGLSQMIGVINNKKDFLVRCIYGLASDFPMKITDKIALKVSQLCNIKLPSNNPSLIYWNNKNDTIAPFINECNIEEEIWKVETFSIKSLPIIKTKHVCKDLKIIKQWLDNKYPFILVGSQGCGKSKLIKKAFTLYIKEKNNNNKNVNVASIHCNAYTKSCHIIKKLYQSCSCFNSNNGKVLRPNGCDSLILYLKDINLPKPDHYNTSQIIELLQQCITYKGFYDQNLDFVHLEQIQFVFSMNNSNTLGTHRLSTRFTAQVGILAITEPANDQLNLIYATYCSIVSSISQLNSEQSQIVQSISSAMIDIYHEIKTAFRRDEYRHFIPTLRDLTEWCFGLIRYPLHSVSIITVWYNEAMRLFYDQMPNQTTKQKLENIIRCSMNKYKLSLKPLKESTLYCTFVTDAGYDDDDKKELDETQKCIQEMGLSFACVSIDDFRTVISSKIRLYEKEFNELHLILFEEFLLNLEKLDRIISHGYRHNMVLIGNSGIGRKIIIKLLCYIHRIECRILKISQQYHGSNQFANTLKDILKCAGIDGNKILLYIQDCQLIDNVMLEYLNELVTTGDIIGLFEDKELDALLTPIKEEYRQNGINQYKSIYDYFVSRVCNNLYIALSMDPQDKNYAIICQTNPSLITNCNVVWMGNQWNNNSMIQYAQSQIEPILNHCSTDEESQHLLQQIQSLHHDNIEYGSCPRSLMMLISVYNSIFKQKLSHNQQLKGHLMSGLKKLNEAEEIVDELSIKATKQREELKQKQKEADLALNEITKSMTKANERRDDAEQLKVKLAEKEVILNERKKHIEVELADIQPLLDEAKAAVGQIRRDSLNELRMLRLPPEAINDVLSGVLILMGNFDTSWHSMKSFLAKPSIKQEIMNYDARRITPKIRNKANQLLSNKPDSFEPKRIQRVSVAAAPLAAWFKANISYSTVLEKIAPLEQELTEAQSDIDDAQHNMNKVEHELTELDEQVSSLKVNFTKLTSEAEALKISLKNAQDTLDRAQTLLKKLLDEKHRWDEQVNDIQRVTVLLPKYCLIVANFITYLGGYPENVRDESIKRWIQIVIHDSDAMWSVLRFMNNESDLLQWKSEGLPDDQLSYENAMIILNAILFPFIIDPNGDATNWLTKHLKIQNIAYETIQQSDSRFMKQLELSVRFGKTIIITDIDSINPCLYPLLRKDITKQGARQVISVGDKWIDYNPQFQLYLITRNYNFSLSSRCKSLVTELNFSVTKSGLESQLLAITLRSEQPELETKKSQLLQSEEQYKVQLAQLEKELLQQLAMSSGNILENMSLIQSLNNTKIQSQNIKTALQQSKMLQNDLNQQREIYRVLAVIGSNAYFTITSLQSLNIMYQFSLSTFLSLFECNLQNMSKKEPEKDITQHIKTLQNNLVSSVYNYISRSLFKSDRLSFGLHFVHSLYKNICKENQWEYFIGEIISSSSDANIQMPSWINSDLKQSFKDLCSNFKDLILKCEFTKYSTEWALWMRSTTPETSFKSNILSKISPITDFEELLLIHTFRKDRLSIATNTFIHKYLHLKSSSSSVVALKELYQHETHNNIPILFITTPGADPSNELRELALNIVGKDNYHEMAMSSGQQYDAINLIKIGSEKGHWICLKNLHLVISWIKQLQQLLSTLNPSPDFRLWLTTESHSLFPSVLLQHSLKITCEPPPGVKQNLKRTLSLCSEQYMALNNNPIRSQLLFMLSWFHAIIQERRTYVPCGWSKYYEFNEADLRASMDIMDGIFKKDNISNSGQLPWKLLWGLLSQAIYGGRIDNDIDFNTLNTYLHSYFNSNIISMRNVNVLSVPGSKWLSLMPKSIRKYEYINLINTMSNTDSPDIFGLPLNANNIVSLQNAKQLLQSLKLLSVINVIDDISSIDAQRKSIAPLIKLWKTISSNCKETIDSKQLQLDDDNAVTDAISLEIVKVSVMIRCVNKSITRIEKGLFGSGALSGDDMDNIKELISGVVPWSWNKLWNKGCGPSNPKTFLMQSIKRKEILDKWVIQLKENTFLKSNIVIGHCFYPTTFLNAFKQYTSHKLQTTMDNLEFKCVWDINSIQIDKSIPILHIDGLYIEGALFDGKHIKHVSSKDNALSKAPVCYLYYDHRKQAQKKSNKMDFIKVPVYYSLDRSYKVFDVALKVNDKLKWSLNGLAFIMTNVY